MANFTSLLGSRDTAPRNRYITYGYDFQIFNNDGVCTHLQDWAGLDPMMSASRFAKLQSLQKMTEMQEFLEFIAKEGQWYYHFIALRR